MSGTIRLVMRYVLFSSILVALSPGARADVGEYLTFRNLARSAEDIELVNALASELAQINYEHQQFLYDMDLQLLTSGAVTVAGLAESLTKLLAAQFNLLANQ